MRRRSLGSAGIKLFRLDYEEIMRKLKGYARRALSKGARTVILIGSLARGDYTAFSDADVIVICDEAPERHIDRAIPFMDPSMPVDVEPRVYTTEEFLRMAREGRRVVREAVEHGILLAGSGEVVERAKELLRERGSTASSRLAPIT